MIRLAAIAAETISNEAVRSVDGSETGGILLGHDHLDNVVITTAGGPGPNAIREPRRFSRDLAYSEALADRAYVRDGSVWIGEWHTHPRGGGEPSPIDLATCLRHLGDPQLDFVRFLTLIITPCPEHGWDEVIISPWLVERDAAVLQHLTVA